MCDNKQHRRLCWVWNNYPDDEEIILTNLKKCKYSYVCYGKEIAPTTGTPHLQGYIEFNGGKRFSTLAKAAPGIHFIVCNGTGLQNKDYCFKGEQTKTEWLEFGTKGPNYGLNAITYEDGELKIQGERTDIQAAMEDIKNGMDEMTFIEKHTDVACRYNRTMDRYRLLCEKKASKGYNPKDVRIYWGESGAGKTRKATEEFPDGFILRETNTGFWWDGYDGEEVIVIEEFTGNVPLSQLLGWIDGYSCQIAIKGGSKLLKAKIIIFTSNINPDDWYKGVSEERRHAFFRRINTIKEFKR